MDIIEKGIEMHMQNVDTSFHSYQRLSTAVGMPVI